MASFALTSFSPAGPPFPARVTKGQMIHPSGLPHVHKMMMMTIKASEASIIYLGWHSKQFMRTLSILTELGGRCHFSSDFINEERKQVKRSNLPVNGITRTQPQVLCPKYPCCEQQRGLSPPAWNSSGPPAHISPSSHHGSFQWSQARGAVQSTLT